MKRLLSGMASLLALFAGVSCSDPTDSLRNGMDHIDATPSKLFIQPGESKTVLISGYDGQGNPQSANYEITAVGSNITVVRDTTFRPIYVNDSVLQVPTESPTYRFIVTATGYAGTEFTVSAAGKSVTVPVQSAAQTVLQAEVSDTLPALGEVVTITLPAGVSFSPTTTVTLADTLAVQPFAVTIAPDNKSLTFLPPPNMISAQLVISDVVSDATPNLPFSPFTAQRFTTPELKLLDATISNFAPPGNATITVTLNNATFDPATVGFSIGGAQAFVTNLSGGTATVLPTPGSVGLLTATGVVPDSLPGYTLPLTSPEGDTVTVGPASEAGGTDDPGTAPSLTVGPPGSTIPFFDVPDFAATIDHFYKLTPPADGDYTISVDWDIGSDIDLIVCDATITDCDFQAATGSQPEEGVYPLIGGTTYFVVVEDFGEDANGATVTIAVTAP